MSKFVQDGGSPQVTDVTGIPKQVAENPSRVLMERVSDGSKFVVLLMEGSVPPNLNTEKKYPYVEFVKEEKGMKYYQEVSAPVKDLSKPQVIPTPEGLDEDTKPIDPKKVKPSLEAAQWREEKGVAFCVPSYGEAVMIVTAATSAALALNVFDREDQKAFDYARDFQMMKIHAAACKLMKEQGDY